MRMRTVAGPETGWAASPEERTSMRKNFLAVLVSVGVVTTCGMEAARAQAVPNRPASARAPSASLKNRFAGTWKLVSIEQRNTKGDVVPPSAAPQNRLGYIIYDPAGYVAVSIMPVGRKKYSGPQPTDDEVTAALGGYAAYFGTFIIHEAEGYVIHRLQGSLNPGMETDQKRFFEFNQNRLTLKPPPAANGNQSRITWERVPDLEKPTLEQQRFFGF